MVAPGRIATPGGREIAFERWSVDSGTATLFVHGTGFCKELWRPVAAEVRPGAPVLAGVAMDQMGHGDSTVLEPPHPWRELGADTAAVAHAVLDAPRIGVGHSSGGAALCIAELAEPGTFAGLILIEPIVVPGPVRRAEDLPIAIGAVRRRPSFSDRAEAAANFGEREPFSLWRPDVLDLYLDHGFRDEDGRRELKCRPQTEAEVFFEGLNHDTWDRLDEITCPVVVLAGEGSETHGAALVAALTARFVDATSSIVSGATHSLPMERPDVVAGAAQAMASRIS